MNESVLEFIKHAAAGKVQKILGIKLIRDLTGFGLKEAKDQWEAWEREGKALSQAEFAQHVNDRLTLIESRLQSLEFHNGR